MSEITTRRLLLRPFTERHEARFVDLKTHPENMAHTHAGAVGRDQARKMLGGYLRQWRDSQIGMWAVMEKVSETFIGECGFATRPGFDGLTLRYTLDRRWWGRGLASEAVEAVLEHGRELSHVSHVSALALQTNTRSCRILENAGMKLAENDFEGVAGFRRYALSLNGKGREG